MIVVLTWRVWREEYAMTQGDEHLQTLPLSPLLLMHLWTLFMQYGGAVMERTWTKLLACKWHGYSLLGPWCIIQWTVLTLVSTPWDRMKSSHKSPYLHLPAQVIFYLYNSRKAQSSWCYGDLRLDFRCSERKHMRTPTHTFILDFWFSEAWEIKFLFLNTRGLWYFVMVTMANKHTF